MFPISGSTQSQAATLRRNAFRFVGSSEDRVRNFPGVAPVAKLDGDEISFSVAKAAEQKSPSHLETVMDNLRASFEDVADWCEKHLENKRCWKFGMTFGAMLRTYGQLATLPSSLNSEQWAAEERQLNAKAEELLKQLSTRNIMAYDDESNRIKPVQPMSVRVNMTYDTYQRPQVRDGDVR